MTAINVFVGDKVAHIFTDGALVDSATGNIAEFGTKVYLFPHLNAAISANGDAVNSILIWSALTEAGFQSFDEMAAAFGETIMHTANRPAPTISGKFKAVLVGWSEASGKPEALTLTGHNSGDGPAFVAKKTRKSITPFDGTMTSFEFDESDPAKSGIDIMERQRGREWAGQAGKSIGGFCQHTVIDGDSITTRVIRRWPEDFESTSGPQKP